MKILVLAPRFPYPLDKGDKLRLYNQIVQLSKRYEIYLFALSHKGVGEQQLQALRPYCKDIRVGRFSLVSSSLGVLLSFFRGYPLQLGWWSSHKVKKSFAAFHKCVQPDVVYCQMVRTIPVAEGVSGCKILDFQDALSLNIYRRLTQTHGLLRPVLNYEYRALRRIEQRALSIFNATTIISEPDRDVILHNQENEQSRKRAIAIVPNGVDFDFFTNKQIDKTTTRYSIVFCGNMAYAPNVDAARYLVEEIMPLVWEKIPQANVLLAGADPKPVVRSLASERVTVSGRLPDIRTAYSSSHIFVAPMRIGSGLQNKLLEAMSMGLPCVTTSIANIPLGAKDGEQILVGDTPDDFADNIMKLLGSEHLRDCIASAGNGFVHQRYGWSAAIEPLERIINEQLESK